MKKQFLVLTFLSLAFMFAGIRSYGQDPHVLSQAPTSCQTPTALSASCGGTIDELHPQAGQPYTYSITTTDPADQVHWFVLNYADLTAGDSLIDRYGNMTASTALIDPGTGSGEYILSTDAAVYNKPVGVSGQTTHSINITWKSFDGKLPAMVLLVAHVQAADGCTNNIEVYRIVPIFNFTLDLIALTNGGLPIDTTSTPAEECVSPIWGANYVPNGDLAGDGTLTVDYGENWVFFMVTAANFTHSWLPSFQVSYSGSVVDPLRVDWAYANQANDPDAWNATTGSAGIYSSGASNPVLHSGTNLTTPTIGADDGDGECIVVRVKIDHGTVNENAVNTTTLRFAVNGIMYDANDTTGDKYSTATLADLHHANCTADGYTNDKIHYDLTPRPQIISTTGDPDLPFELNPGDTEDPNFGENN